MAELGAREQLFLELINRARMDPVGEAARLGLSDLNANLAPGSISVQSKQVLAPNALLTNAAIGHSQWILDTDVFSHTGVNGSNPGARMTNAGYGFTGAWSWGENIAWSGSTGTLDLNASVMEQYRGLFLSAGHRENILHDAFAEVGIASITGLFTTQPPDGNTYNAAVTTQDFARSGTKVFVTGVTYNDTDNNDFYSIGEGVGGRTFDLMSGTAVLASSASAAGGGYAIGTSTAGIVELHVSGGGLTADIGVSFTVGADNVKIDLVDGNAVEANVSAALTRGSVNLVLLGTESISGIGNALNNTISGNGASNPILRGLGGADTIMGGGGNDWIEGESGNDPFAGVAGNDILNGENGDDTILAGGGDDVLYGGAGTDFLIGEQGNDLIYGGSEWDALDGRQGSDVLYGEGGDDIIFGDGYFYVFGFANDSLYGGAGNDIMMGEAGESSLSGGNDVIYGDGGDDLLDGGGGDDTIYGGDGNDVIDGDHGNDYIVGGPGADIMLGSNAVNFGGATTGSDYFVYQSMADAGDRIFGFDLRAGNEDKLFLQPMIATFTGVAARTLAGLQASGHLRLVDTGADIAVQADADGGANNYVMLVTLVGVANVSDLNDAHFTL